MRLDCCDNGDFCNQELKPSIPEKDVSRYHTRRKFLLFDERPKNYFKILENFATFTNLSLGFANKKYHRKIQIVQDCIREFESSRIAKFLTNDRRYWFCCCCGYY